MPLEFDPRVFLLSLLISLAGLTLILLWLRLARRINLLAKLRGPGALFALFLVASYSLRHSSLHVPSGVIAGSRLLILVAGAYLGVKVAEVLLIDIFLTRWKGVRPPAILGNVLCFFLYLLSLFLILHYVLQVNLTPILATSAVVTVVVGLALQDILGNLFSGLALHWEKPFQVGDWVSIRDQLGRVAEMSWRSVKLQTPEDHFLIIPNASISREILVNYSQPDRPHARVLRVGLPYGVPPTKVRQVVEETARKVPGVMADPSPLIRPLQYGSYSIEYEIRLWISDFSRFIEIEGEFLKLLWFRLDRAGIYIPFPTHHLYVHPFSPRVQADSASQVRKEIAGVLRGVDILSPLNDCELEKVAAQVRTERYAAGEVVLRQGDSGDSFFVIKEGMVEVSLGEGREQRRVLARLGRGNFFGEMSLLTGETRSANVIALTDCEFLVLNKEGFHDVLSANPMIAQALSQILAKRRLELDQERAKGLPKEKLIAESSQSILEKIKAFFGLT
jgi:small-conductance mechanosensitive channel/CRP-like cAMP-binding protein